MSERDSTPGSPQTSPSFDLLPSLSARLLARALWPLARISTRCEGAERLPRIHGPAIFALNHNNSFECAAVPVVLLAARGGRPVHFLIDWMYLEIPLLGWLLSRIEPIPVFTKRARFSFKERYRRNQSRRGALEQARLFLSQGRAVGIFPEGVRNTAVQHLAPARRGLGWLALASAAPVVPVGIEYEAAQHLGRVPSFGRLVIRVGEPQQWAEAPWQPDGISRQAAAEVTVAVMSQLAELCSKAKAPGLRPLLRSRLLGKPEPILPTIPS